MNSRLNLLGNAATAVRRRRQHDNPGERLAAFVRLQQASFQLLAGSPHGWDHFYRRNLRSRRAEVIDGEWKPVSPDRRAPQA